MTKEVFGKKTVSVFMRIKRFFETYPLCETFSTYTAIAYDLSPHSSVIRDKHSKAKLPISTIV
jgi:hypothetical protein